MPVSAPMPLGGTFDYDAKKERLEEVVQELAQPEIWENPERAQALGKEQSALEAIVENISALNNGLDDGDDLLDMALEEDDADTLNEVEADIEKLVKTLEALGRASRF